MTVNKDVPAKTVAEFIEYVKANPGKVNMASSGNGTSVHLSGEMFMAMTGCKMQHVPYRGAAPAITDMLGGQRQVIFDNMPSIIQHIRGGALRALGVTTAERSPQLPDVQAIGETVKGYEASALFGMGAPAKTPKEIIAKLNASINAVMDDPAMTKQLVELGGEPRIQLRKLRRRDRRREPRSGRRWSNSQALRSNMADQCRSCELSHKVRVSCHPGDFQGLSERVNGLCARCLVYLNSGAFAHRGISCVNSSLA